MTQIACTGIEAEMLRQQESNKDLGLTHACLFNLIFYIEDSRRKRFFEQLLNACLNKFPCRVLFISAFSNTSDELVVEVSTIPIELGEAKIACFRIDVQAGGQKLKEIPYLILPHLVSDLPTFLVCGDDDTKDPSVLDALLRLATRVIWDSEGNGPVASLCALLLRWREIGYEIQDINWIQIGSWRDALEQVFSIEKKITELSHIQSVKLVYNTSEFGTEFFAAKQALYFQAWLASSLSWTFSRYDADAKVIYYQSTHGEVRVEMLQLAKEDIQPGALMAVEISSMHAELNLQRIGVSAQLLVHVTIGDYCELPMRLPLPSVSGGVAFQRELFYSSPSMHFFQMLRVLSQSKFEGGGTA